MAAKIPDPYVKHAFSKYIWHNETVGEYMITSIIQSENFFNLVLDYEGNLNTGIKYLIVKETTPKEAAKVEPVGSGMSWMKKIAKKIDDVKQNPKISALLDNQGQPSPSPKPVPGQNNLDFKNAQEGVTPVNAGNTEPTSFSEASPANINALNSQQSNPPEQTVQNQNTQPTKPTQIIQTAETENPDDFFEFPEVKRQLFTTYYANNPFCVFIQGDSFKNSASEDKRQMLEKV